MTDTAAAAGRAVATASIPARQPYRPDIDGLRAVAVVLVVAYHFGIPGFSGGYIGVDLFFVISGFLIASIFRRQPDMTLQELVAFYGRRIKRLMPAFLFVAVVTIAVGSALLLPADYEALLTSVRESSVARANLYFERATSGYFAAASTEMPWLHTWSLSVEWQFYLLFPLVAAALQRLSSERARSVVSWSLLSIGVALSTWMVHDDAVHAYFSAPARFFEFFAGALAASIPGPPTNVRRSRWLSVAGTAVLLALANRFTAATPFPGPAALAVCAVGFVLIATGRSGSILADARLVGLGKRSYSIYLWHWPIVAMLNAVQHRPSPLETAAWFVVILAAADATWRWIEVPGLALRWRPRSAFAALCVLPFACTAVAAVFVRNHGGFPQRLGPEAQHAYANVRRFETGALDRCHDYRSSDIEACAFGDRDGPTRALLIGDSHARHFEPFLQQLAADAHVKVYGLTDSECLTLTGSRPASLSPLRSACADAVARDYRLIRDERFKYVFIAQRWIGYPQSALGGLDASLDAIVASGAIPVLLMPVAEDGTDPKDCFFHHVKIREPMVGDCAIRADNDFARPAKTHVVELVRDLQRKHPSLVLIDPQAAQCRNGSCVTVLDRTTMYTDTHHLNAFGSTMLARSYLQHFGNPLLANPK